ncbi:MAG: LCP family protein [Chloroflexi bacterium]|nr:LCP family protein [Chloroflexota bacterium]
MKKIKRLKMQDLSLGLVFFWCVVIAAAIGIFIYARSFTACWNLTSLPGIPPSTCGGAAETALGTPLVIQGTPAASLPPTPESAPVVEPPQWDGASRINIVFFGLRSSGADISGPNCPACTDTIILFTVDPVSKSAAMISIPRDMYVNIPGFGYSRINTAWTSGEAAKLPGGGPGLAMKTVSQFIGVPVQYYVNVDFKTFISLINTLGGVDVYVNQKLILDPMGTGLDHVVVTCCGMRHLNGQVALAYARARDASQGATYDDIGRAQRQQQIILAIQKKIFSPEYFPTFIAQAPTLYKEFSAGIHTNLTFDDAVKLAYLVNQIPRDKITSAVIDYTMINTATVTLAGQPADVFIPISDKIHALTDQIFLQGGLDGPIAQGDPRQLMQADNAQVRVLNGTNVPQLDARSANFLISQGMRVVGLGQAPQLYSRTTIIIYSPKLYALRYLIKIFGVTSSSQIIFKNDPSSTADITVMLGNDWVGKLPAGY